MSENIISFANDMKDFLPLIMSVCQQQEHYGHDSNLERGLMDVNGEIWVYLHDQPASHLQA